MIAGFARCLAIACAGAALAGAGQADPCDWRRPFALEISGFRFTEPEISLAASSPERVQFHISDPVASAVPSSAIHTTINGEPAATIQTIARSPAGRRVTCDLRQWPRFALKPGRNDLRIYVDGHAYAASYVVFIGAPAPGPAFVPSIAFEKRRAASGGDTEPPAIEVSPLQEPPPRGAATLRLHGYADDNRGVLAVSIDGRPARVTRSTRAQASAGAVEFTEDVVVGELATQVVVEATDRAGNASRALLRLARPAAALSRSPAVRGKRAAVIAGVSQYQNPEDGFGNLHYAARDAQAVYDLLADPGIAGWPSADLELLLDRRATRAAFRGALERAASGLYQDDVLFLYVAAHGAVDRFAGSGRGPLYVLFHDARASDLPRTALPMEELRGFLDARVKSRVVAFVDMCHSAGILESFGASLAARSDMAVMASSGVGEVSRERPDLDGGHGVFTYALLEALRGAADANGDGLITGKEVFSSVQHRVRELTDERQNPEALSGAHADLPLLYVKTRGQ